MSDQIVAVSGGRQTGPAEAVRKSVELMGYESVPEATAIVNEDLVPGQALMAFVNRKARQALAVCIYGPVEVVGNLVAHRMRGWSREDAEEAGRVTRAWGDCGRLTVALDQLGLIGDIDTVSGCMAEVAMDHSFALGRVKAAYDLANVRIG